MRLASRCNKKNKITTINVTMGLPRRTVLHVHAHLAYTLKSTSSSMVYFNFGAEEDQKRPITHRSFLAPYGTYGSRGPSSRSTCHDLYNAVHAEDPGCSGWPHEIMAMGLACVRRYLCTSVVSLPTGVSCASQLSLPIGYVAYPEATETAR